MKQRLTAWIYFLLAAVVCLSAADGSLLLCLHTSGELHAPTDEHEAVIAEPVSVCESEQPCCEVQRDTDCVDLQIDGLDLDFAADHAKALKAFTGMSLPVEQADLLLPKPSACFAELQPTRAPPIVGPHVHVSIAQSVLRN
ncbi:hypothetical protein [Cerasicoccus maritimus]|uniref:hypothetical protein n=1 Tax=Cerasicoccus maritimus TaxID=490089 RepID=UPI002852552B|nr:hypothetical protein [Cerasicoccus maritimus]